MAIIVRSVESVLTLVQNVVDQQVTTFTIYGSVRGGDAYFGSLLRGQRWTFTDDIRKRQALNEATMLIDQLNFVGEKADATQPLQFPRGTDTLVPEAIERATYEVAVELLKGVDPNTERDNLSAIVQAYGGLRTEFDRTSVPAHFMAGIPSFTAWQLLLPFLEPRLGIVNRRVS